MPSVSRTVLVPYGAHQMFELVQRVEDYPEFLPWCGGSVVHVRDDARALTTIRIDFRGLKQSFTTENLYDRPSRIEIRLKDGPFTQLDGDWQFVALGDDACRVALRLDYQFAGALVSRALAPVFDHIAGSMIDAFVRRAESRYG
jgi:ribosome-associated toxin RatA of RatAB toxin-antitoxin module